MKAQPGIQETVREFRQMQVVRARTHRDRGRERQQEEVGREREEQVSSSNLTKPGQRPGRQAKSSKE